MPTLRFLLPVAGALGANATFQLAGRLAQRPMAPLLEQLEAHGCQTYLDPEKKTLSISGQLTPGAYRLPGDVSSQFFTGLLFALPLLGEESILEIEGELESASYLQLTIQALAAFGVTPERMETGWIVRPQAYRTPGRAIVEGDWLNAAPWLCMGAIDGDSVTVKGLAPDSQQGDRAVCRVLGEMGVPIHHTADRYTSHPGRLHPTTIDARDIPDLVPVLAALAASIPGTTIITGAARLRLKESDRLVTTAATLNALGGQVAVTDDGLIIQGKAHLLGGTVDAAGTTASPWPRRSLPALAASRWSSPGRRRWRNPIPPSGTICGLWANRWKKPLDGRPRIFHNEEDTMSSVFHGAITVSIFGQSHAPGIGVVVDGLPAGEKIDLDELQAFLTRRAPGTGSWPTPRKEADAPEILSGLADGVTCGAPLAAVIRNTNTRSKDYSNLRDIPRPGHADFTAQLKYGGWQDVAGGGHFSGRLTAPLCIAGGICKQILARRGITVGAHIAGIGGILDTAYDPVNVTAEDLLLTSKKRFPVLDDAAGEKMQAAIEQARSELDSLGGLIECGVTGLPVGLGDPMLDGMENRMARLVFAIPAVKGVEFGAGFAVAEMRGSENNDPFYYDGDTVKTRTNHAGGILGGITNGMPLVFRAAVKPTPSIARVQDSVSLSQGVDTKLEIHGRHDPCIVPRAVPCVEAAAAIAVYDALLSQQAIQQKEK